MRKPPTPFTLVWSAHQETLMLNMLHPAMSERYSRTVAHLQREAAQHFTLVNPNSVDMETMKKKLILVHEADYVLRLTQLFENDNWPDAPNEELSQLALLSVAATEAATWAILDGQSKIAYAVASGQHHAKYDRGAGFCALNDIVIAAEHFKAYGLKPIVIDIDIHAGDGTQEMLWDSNIPTVSVHMGNIYPWDARMEDVNRVGQRHPFHHPSNHAYNFVVEPHAGDDALAWAADGIDTIIRAEMPDVIIFVVGADGHEGTTESDAMETNYASYTYGAFNMFAARVRNWADELTNGRILMTGAGGYQGKDHTPRIWANVVEVLAGIR